MNQFLLVFEAVFFIFGGIILFRQEKLFGVYFFSLWVYVLFAQIGYLYFPWLSAAIFAYFGERIWQPVAWFVILSAITLFLYLQLVGSSIVNFGRRMLSHVAIVDQPNAFLRRVVLTGYTLLLLLQTVIFIVEFPNVSWINAQQDDVFRTTPLLGIFILLVKVSVALNIAFYVDKRERKRGHDDSWNTVLVIVSLMCFMLFTFKLGDRTDDVAMLLGISFYEMNRVRLRPKHLLIAAGAAVIVVAYLNTLESLRAQSGHAEKDVAAAILVKDYYAPAHVLFAAFAFHEVHPLLVLESNVGNSLMFLKQPYLQAKIMDNFFPGGATRSASYGLYPLTEGYMVLGFAGFIYNGIVLGTLLSIWRALATTQSKPLNRFTLAIMGSMAVNLVRGQSSYFIKLLYNFMLPGLLFYLALSGQKIVPKFRLVYSSPPKQSGHE